MYIIRTYYNAHAIFLKMSTCRRHLINKIEILHLFSTNINLGNINLSTNINLNINISIS